MSGGNTTAASNKALDTGVSANRSFVVNDLAGRRVTVPVPLISAAQDFTAAWAALGPEIAVDGFTRISVWLELDVNLGKDMQIRCRGRHTSGGTGYDLPIKVVDTSVSPFNVKIEPAYYEFNTDVDQNVVVTWEINNTYPFIYFEVKAGTVGGTACQVDAANITYGWGQ